MSNQLEAFIRSHRNELDLLDAPEGVWAGIVPALPNANENKLKKQVYAQRLAMSALLLIAVMGWGLWFFQPSNSQMTTLPPEMQELEAVYTQKINLTIDEIKTQKVTLNNYPDLSQTLTVHDSVYEELLLELRLHPDNPQVIDKMVQYYEERLAFLERVKERLQRRQRIQQL